MRLGLSASVLLIIVCSALFSGVSAAQSSAPGPITVVAVDGPAMRVAPDRNMADSAVQVLARSQANGALAFLTFGAQTNASTLVAAGSTKLQSELSQFVGSLGSSQSGTSTGGDLRALTAAFDLLSSNNAPHGSRVVLVTSAQLGSDVSTAEKRLSDFAALYPKQGWQIDVVMLPSASASARSFLTKLAQDAQGTAFDTGTVDGVSRLVTASYNVQLTSAIRASLVKGQSTLAPVDVPPSSDELTVVGIRESASTTIQLFDPNGVAVANGQGGAQVLQTPGVAVFRVKSPVSGRWSLHAVGGTGMVLAGYNVANRLKVQLVNQPPFPTGRPATLEAEITLNGHPTPVPGATVQATVQAPDGTSNVYSLKDDGTGADAHAGDGIFSVALPTQTQQAIFNVSLKVSWPDEAATLEGSGSFKTEPFPRLEVKALNPAAAQKDVAIPAAELSVQVGKYPYPVHPNALSVSVTDPSGAPISDAQLQALNPLADGEAWQFQAMVPPDEAGAYQVTAKLSVNYLGRAYTASPNSIGVNLPNPKGSGKIAGLPLWAWVILGLAIVGGGGSGWALYDGARKTMPSGYFLDDRGQVVVDFYRLRMSRLRRLLSRNLVRGKEVPELAITNVDFVFQGDAVEVRVRGKEPNIRVNGEPVSRRASLRDGDHIGATGRLYLYSHRRSGPAL